MNVVAGFIPTSYLSLRVPIYRDEAISMLQGIATLRLQ
jgi:hypothetical protein